MLGPEASDYSGPQASSLQPVTRSRCNASRNQVLASNQDALAERGVEVITAEVSPSARIEVRGQALADGVERKSERKRCEHHCVRL